MKRGGPEHPKVALLAQLLNIEIWGAVGILEMLWHFTSKYAPQGDIGKYSDEVIARAVGWGVRSGSRGVPTGVRLRSALVQAGVVDTCPINRLVVHDWKDHADEAVRKFLSRHHLDFVQTQSSLPLPLPLPLPEPEPADKTAGVLNSGEPRPNGAAAAALPPPALPAEPAHTLASAAAVGAPLAAELAGGVNADKVCLEVLQQMGAEGLLPPRYIANEYGREERNPVSERIEGALARAIPRIREARKPAALARKIVLDELKGA